MAIRLIAFDMDDTLLRDDRTIGERTIAALRAAHERGVVIVANTGRGKQTMWDFVRQIGVVDASICTNGAQIYDKDGNILAENPVPMETAKRVARLAKQGGWYVQGYSADSYFFEKVCAENAQYAEMAGHTGDEVGDLEQYICEDPYKMLFLVNEPERMQALKDAAYPAFSDELFLCVSKPFFLELTSKKASKGAALMEVAKLFGVMPSETMAIGDSGNDVSMIQAAGVGVAMGNATEELKAHADYITLTNEEEGVAAVIEKFILREGTAK